jgi:hypothetical protein
MRASHLVLSLVLALAPGLAFAQFVGECGGTGKQADGKKVTCQCGERPTCDLEGDCECVADADCNATACRGAPGTLAHLEPVRPFDLPLGAR